MSDPNADLIRLLRDVRRLLSLPDNNFIWSPWKGIQDATDEIDGLIGALEAGDGSVIDRLETLFAPTGAIQEVSVSSGWDQEFLELADRFDGIVEDRT